MQIEYADMIMGTGDIESAEAALAIAPQGVVTLREQSFDPLVVYGAYAQEVVRIASDGRIFWRGREVETDVDFRATMLELLVAMQPKAAA